MQGQIVKYNVPVQQDEQELPMTSDGGVYCPGIGGLKQHAANRGEENPRCRALREREEEERRHVD